MVHDTAEARPPAASVTWPLHSVNEKSETNTQRISGRPKPLLQAIATKSFRRMRQKQLSAKIRNKTQTSTTKFNRTRIYDTILFTMNFASAHRARQTLLGVV
jgi:hypothetical protein